MSCNLKQGALISSCVPTGNSPPLRICPPFILCPHHLPPLARSSPYNQTQSGTLLQSTTNVWGEGLCICCGQASNRRNKALAVNRVVPMSQTSCSLQSLFLRVQLPASVNSGTVILSTPLWFFRLGFLWLLLLCPKMWTPLMVSCLYAFLTTTW